MERQAEAIEDQRRMKLEPCREQSANVHFHKVTLMLLYRYRFNGHAHITDAFFVIKASQ